MNTNDFNRQCAERMTIYVTAFTFPAVTHGYLACISVIKNGRAIHSQIAPDTFDTQTEALAVALHMAGIVREQHPDSMVTIGEN